MKKRRFSIGPGAASLILMVVVVSMSVLGMLSLISARNDDNLTKRSMQVTAENYVLNGKSERSLMLVDTERMIAAADGAADDAAYMERIAELLEQKYPGRFDVDTEERTVYWSEYCEYNASDVVNTVLYRITGAEVGGRKCMNCAVRIASLEDSSSAPVQWIRHTIGSDMIADSGAVQ